MIQSMTGFGKVTAELPSRKVTVEIKALNSKQLDLSTRIPAYLQREGNGCQKPFDASSGKRKS